MLSSSMQYANELRPLRFDVAAKLARYVPEKCHGSATAGSLGNYLGRRFSIAV
jgi:hypothetical protein